MGQYCFAVSRRRL